jgi:NhaP-type Na+/H+ or K+/H+ antiporter
MKKRRYIKNRRSNIMELKTISYIATLILAGFLVYMNVESPSAWGFLGGALGLLFGQSTETKCK